MKNKIRAGEELKKVEEEEQKIISEEAALLSELRKKRLQPSVEERRRRWAVKHLRLSDFCQSTIGVGVFGLSVMITPDLWDMIEAMNTRLVILAHLFFCVLFFIALNYEFTENWKWNALYARNIIKRYFFVYLSVMVTVIFLLFVTEKITLGMMNYNVLRNFMAGQSVGLMGAVTFALFKK